MSSKNRLNARDAHRLFFIHQPAFYFLVRNGAAFGHGLQTRLDLLFHVQLLHDVIPGGLIGQMFDQLFSGLFRCGHRSPRLVPAFSTFNKKALIVRCGAA